MKKQLIVALAALTALSSVAMADAPAPCDGMEHFGLHSNVHTGQVVQLTVPPICPNINTTYNAFVGGG